MGKARSFISARCVCIVVAVAFIHFLPPSTTRAAALFYGGSVFQPVNSGFEALGTFKPGFDPHSIVAVYGDPALNLFGFYTRMVTDGNFRPLNSGLWSGQTFSGTADAAGVPGQPLWLLLFNNPNPDQAFMSVVCSGTDSSWLAPQGVDNTFLNGNSANLFVLGSGGRGSPLSLDIQPFPEPSSAIALLVSAMILLPARPRRSPR